MSVGYPRMGDYKRAALKSTAFVSPALRHLTLYDNPDLPYPDRFTSSGKYAVVFFGQLDGRGDIAIKCFTSPPGSRRKRYTALKDRLLTIRNPRGIVNFEWVDDAIEVKSELFPALVMDRIDGQLLPSWVHEHLGDRKAIQTLAHEWRVLCAELVETGIAHGDLQGGNVMIMDGRIVLVDLDGIWIPSLDHDPPLEVGHPAFQHPSRLKRGAYHRYADTFSALVVYTSLLALAQQPNLWPEFDKEKTDENLLFYAPDFTSDSAGKTDVWKAVRKIPDEHLKRALDSLEAMCRAEDGCDWPITLEDVLDSQMPSPIASQPSPAADTTSWWVEAEKENSARKASPNARRKSPPKAKGPLRTSTASLLQELEEQGYSRRTQGSSDPSDWSHDYLKRDQSSGSATNDGSNVFSATVAQARKQLGLSIAEVARHVNRTPRTVISWESGGSRPRDAKTIEALSLTLGIDTSTMRRLLEGRDRNLEMPSSKWGSGSTSPSGQSRPDGGKQPGRSTTAATERIVLSIAAGTGIGVLLALLIRVFFS